MGIQMNNMADAVEAGLDFGPVIVMGATLTDNTRAYLLRVGADPQLAIREAKGSVDRFIEWLNRTVASGSTTSLRWFAAGLYVYGVVPLLIKGDPNSRKALIGYRRHLQDLGVTVRDLDSLEGLFQEMASHAGSEAGTQTFHRLREQLIDLAKRVENENAVTTTAIQFREFLSMTKHTQKYAAAAFGTVFVVVLIGIAFFVPEPTDFQYLVFRIVLALAAAGVAAMIPGFLEVQLSQTLRAGGALGVFLVVYFYNPAAMVAHTKKSSNIELANPRLQPTARAIVESRRG